MTLTLSRVGNFKLAWGESLRWDDRRLRLYFVDCATHMLHWLEGGEPPPHSLELPSMPAGLASPTETNLSRVWMMACTALIRTPNGGVSSPRTPPECTAEQTTPTQTGSAISSRER